MCQHSAPHREDQRVNTEIVEGVSPPPVCAQLHQYFQFYHGDAHPVEFEGP